MTRKGMSQTLALIVAASVLMMTALTVIFMVQGGLGDVNSGTSRSSCVATVEAKCAGTTGTIKAPTTCYSNGNPIPSAPQYIPPTQGSEFSCDKVNS
ncbi:MAG: hypothetical protein BRC28_00620 [Nanohaloarchaea archaeon SW_4_43_9]|nr:MAG: hypothetical protein BRC28_00620 [Nanohaloarchaea archaeon SW_4_43_9]